MKKIINQPENVINEMIEGMLAAHPNHLKRIPGFNVLIRKEKAVKVALITGGGSGHEPAHAGFIGEGMLDAVAVGEIFTSPSPDQILAGIKEIQTEHGVLMIIKNYSGDIMNFEIAKELAEEEGIAVRDVLVNDDVAVEDSTYTTGRRGIAGTVFAHKIAGALAENGGNLDAVADVAKKVVLNMRSKGVALAPCIVPTLGKPSFELADDEMELGLGIHGEPGTERTKLKSAEKIADDLFYSVFQELNLRTHDKVALMVNGLGATPQMELYILNKHFSQLCAKEGLVLHRSYVGEYMTSLEMAGASLTLIKLDEELAGLLDTPCNTPGLVQVKKEA